MPQQSLLAFDTDRIKSYVFATGTLRDIRGASAILDRLNRHTMTKTIEEIAPEAQTVYAQGGGGLFLLDSGSVPAAQRAVEALYRTETFSASISSAAVTVPSAFMAQSDIQAQMRILTHRLRAAKDRTPPWQALNAHALLRPCEACGVDYASEEWQGPDELMRLCRGCMRKRQEDRRIRDVEIPRWLAQRHLTARASDPLWQRLIVSLRARGYPITEAHERPRDFAEVGRHSHPAGYFGLIYADGDGMGKELEKLRTLDEIRRFAEVVDGAVYDAAVEAITRHLSPYAPEGSLDFDVLLLGGDDLVIVVKAQAAMETALTLVETFSRLTAERWGRPLRMTASVVLTHTSYPFATLLQLAEGSLRFAKRVAAARRRAGEAINSGLLNFLVVSSALHLDYADYYDQVLSERLPGRRALERTLRPYTPSDLRRLLATVLNLHQAPRSKLQQVYEACFLSYEGASLQALAALLRWPGNPSKAAVVDLVHASAKAHGVTEVQFPWFLHGDRWRTPLIDAVELSEFVAATEDLHAHAS